MPWIFWMENQGKTALKPGIRQKNLKKVFRKWLTVVERCGTIHLQTGDAKAEPVNDIFRKLKILGKTVERL